ncbi:hypothetical protein LCGC14_1604020 [marine sediment metagenome]|uniref:Uncharacterized protein n=1 Tax=marine sediment metagenome TaxID=412755 RepID=A0A0F9LAE6_9ZZZZ
MKIADYSLYLFLFGFLIVLMVVGSFIVKNMIEDNKREKQFELESEIFFEEVRKDWNNIPENYTFGFEGGGGKSGFLNREYFDSLKSGGGGGLGGFVFQGTGEKDEN